MNGYNESMNQLKNERTLAGARVLAACLLAAVCVSCTARQGEEVAVTEKPDDARPAPAEVATFGAGCFWCVEAVFEEVDGVTSVESGYCGGTIPDPSYEQICTGATGHVEVCRIHYDPAKVSFVELLDVFWKTHDPTTLNRQGADVGTQYRSVVFYHDDRQKTEAENRKRELNESGTFSAPIVTAIEPAPEFYMAEDYHQDYFRNNPEKAYCRMVIQPKLDKFKKP